MTHVWPKSIMLLALVSFLCALACDSKDGPTAPTSFQEAASVPGPGSFTTGASQEFNDVDLEGEGDDPSGDFDLEDEDICSRSPGFYCQNQDGKNPNMSDEEFQMFADQAALLLATIEELDTPDEVAAAVCDTSDQLFRHLATLALNLASLRINETDPHANPDFPTVGDAFAHAVAVADGSIEVTREERKEVKRMVEQINENVSVNEGKECEQYEDEDEDPDEDLEDPSSAPACNAADPGHSGKILICHKDKNTLSIAPAAWPAHWAHGDTCGACGGS